MIKTNKNNERRYIVTRNGFKVSEIEYYTKADALTSTDYSFWSKVVKNWSPGCKMDVMEKQ